MSTTPDPGISEVNVTSSQRWQQLEQLNREWLGALLPALTLLVLVAVLGLVGNALVLHVYGSKLRAGTTRCFVLSLALVDLITCTAGAGGEAVLIRFTHNFDWDVLCKVITFTKAAPTLASGFLVLAMTVERYKRLCWITRRPVGTRGARGMVAGACVLGALSASPYLALSGSRSLPTRWPDINASQCSGNNGRHHPHLHLAFAAFLLLAFLACFVTLIALYMRIALTVWRRRFVGSSAPSCNSLDVSDPDPQSSARCASCCGENSCTGCFGGISCCGGCCRCKDCCLCEKCCLCENVCRCCLCEDCCCGEDCCRCKNCCSGDENETGFRPSDDDDVTTCCLSKPCRCGGKRAEAESTPDHDCPVSDDADTGIEMSCYSSQSADMALPGDALVYVNRICWPSDPRSDAAPQRNTEVTATHVTRNENRFPQSNLSDGVYSVAAAPRFASDLSINVDVTQICTSPPVSQSDDVISQSQSAAAKDSSLGNRQPGSRKGSRLATACSSPTLSRKCASTRSMSRVGANSGRTTLIIFVIGIVLILSYVPFLIVTLLRDTRAGFEAGLTTPEQQCYQLFLRSYFMQAMANPIIYSFLNVRFRAECARVVRPKRRAIS